MTPHRWIRRRGSAEVDLFIGGVKVGGVRPSDRGESLDRTPSWDWWGANDADAGLRRKADAKRALLRTVREPRVKQRAEAPKPVPANGWSGAYYRVDGEDRGWAVRMTGSNDVKARVYLSHNPTAWISATFCPGPGCSDAEAEARAWVEWRAKGER